MFSNWFILDYVLLVTQILYNIFQKQTDEMKKNHENWQNLFTVYITNNVAIFFLLNN